MEHNSLVNLESKAIVAAQKRADDGGIWSRSSDRSYIIFCVGQKDHQIKRFMRFALRTNLGFKPLRGCYKGKPERSFIVNAKDWRKVQPFVIGQESVLLLHDYNRADVPKATMIYSDGKREELGLFCQATAEVTKHRESWTFDPLSGCYFVAGE